MKNRLAQIDADRMQFHGTPPCSPLIPPAGGSQKAADHPISYHELFFWVCEGIHRCFALLSG
jgi:hypothetical protein